MLTYEVEILESKAEVMLDEMANDKLIKISKSTNDKTGKKSPLRRGSMKGLVLYIADDFDAPLDDFKEYM